MGRMNKRQQREAQELEDLTAARSTATSALPLSDSEDDDAALPVPQQAKGRTAFDMLNDEEDQVESEEEEVVQAVKSKKSNNKKKKKSKAAPLDSPGTPSSSAPKSKSKVDTPTKTSTDGMDEIDRALAELALKGGGTPAAAAPATGHTTARLEPKWQAVKDAYAVDPKFLDADAELRRLFGSKVINTTTVTPQSRHHARFANNPHHSTSLRRATSFLAAPEAGWGPPSGVLTVSRYAGPESATDAGEWWMYDHSRTYREAQLGFLEVLQQADGNKLYNILQGHPYHVDTLMQLSEMMVQQGDLGASSSHLSKALYALSAPLPPSFTSGSFRLPYSLIENRAFFLGVARKVSILVKRGTWRTACEWSKIGLGVGGGADPVGMLVFIDFLAPKARQGPWFLSLLDALHVAYPSMRVASYPGLAYAKALCLRGMEEDAGEDDTKSTAALRSAILRFPMVIPLLFSSLGGTVPPNLLTNRRAQTDGSFTTQPSYLLSLTSELYVARSSPLWKEPPVLSWLQRTVSTTAPHIDDSGELDVRIGEKLWSEGPWQAGYAPAGLIRAAYLSEIPSVRPYLPPSATSGTSYSYDPLPPARDSATFYDETYFAPLYNNPSTPSRTRAPRVQGPDAGTLEMMRNQLAQMLGMGDAGGAVDLGEDLRRELMDELEALGQGGVPGGFPGEEEDETDEEEEDEREEEGRGGLMERLAALMRPRANV